MSVHTRAAAWLLAPLVPSANLREAVLGDLTEVMETAGAGPFWEELLRSLPFLLAARLRAADPLATLALALFTVSPLLIAEWLCARSLSLVPLKVSAARPFWFVCAASLVPAVLAWHAGRDRGGPPALWPLGLGSASLAASFALPWPIDHRAGAIALITLAGCFPRVSKPRRLSL